VSKGRIIAGVVVLAVIGAVVAGVWYSSAASATSVTVARVTSETLGVIVTASGKVEAAHKSDVYPPTAGLVVSVDVSDGDAVKAGDKLAQMDRAPLLLQVKQASSALKGARAQLDAVNKGVPAAIDRSAAAASINAALSAYDAAHAAYATYHDAFVSAGSPASMEATDTQLSISSKQAYAALQAAKSGRSKLTTISKVSLARSSAQSAVDSASYALKLAQDTLDKATLTSPIDGIVVFNAVGAPGSDGTTPKASVGAALAPGSAPFTVVDLTALNFNAQIDEADVAKVKSSMSAKVSLDAFTSTTFPGRVSAIRATAIQTTTGGIAFPVLVAIDPTTQRLLLGMSGSVDIEVNAVSGALTIPIEAVLDDSGKKYVFVVKADKVKRVEITTGALTDTRAQVLTGLSAGDTVATNNLTALKDGMTVRPQ
ncbi:MAG TPA: efflux RND transporter periplasmic adaptor subunit, partial [Coriobacteriia bacterium]